MITAGESERGSVALWTVFMTIVALMLGGLVIDGGYAMSAKREAARTAEQAARAGADQLDTDSLRAGGADLSPATAAGAAYAYLRQVGATGSVAVAGDLVRVTVTDQSSSHILSLFGKGSFAVSSIASAKSIDDDP